MRGTDSAAKNRGVQGGGASVPPTFPLFNPGSPVAARRLERKGHLAFQIFKGEIMTTRPRILFCAAIPLLVAGVTVTVWRGIAPPILTLLFPCGVFLLGLAGISYMAGGEFAKFDEEHHPHAGSPGDHQQHILRPEEEAHHGDLSHAH
jgi:hypothetical protein